jgi:hypothetical protein
MNLAHTKMHNPILTPCRECTQFVARLNLAIKIWNCCKDSLGHLKRDFYINRNICRQKYATGAREKLAARKAEVVNVIYE